MIKFFSGKIWDTWLTWFTGKLESLEMFEGKSNSSDLAYESHQFEPYHVTLIFPLVAALFWFLTQRNRFNFFYSPYASFETVKPTPRLRRCVRLTKAPSRAGQAPLGMISPELLFFLSFLTNTQRKGAINNSYRSLVTAINAEILMSS